MTDRVSCCVPFCRRTRKPDCNEWICGTHWAFVPRRVRLIKFRAERRYKKQFGDNHWSAYEAGTPHRIEAVRMGRLCDWAWKQCKKAAFEGAAGI